MPHKDPLARKEYKRKYHLANQEKAKERAKKWYYANPERNKEYEQKRAKDPVSKAKRESSFYKKNYGITLEQYNQMFVDQNGLCAICNEQETNGKKLAVDHDHKTEEIRGLLCGKCNMGIGLLRDSEELLLKAMGYLKRYK